MRSHAETTIVVFHGESGSGKTTLINYLCNSSQALFTRLVTYTSRPARKHEVDGVDYFFKKENFFFEKGGELILVNTSDEGYHYATTESSLLCETPFLLATFRMKGVQYLIQHGYKVAIVSLVISDKSKKLRMRSRGDGAVEAKKRVSMDCRHREQEDIARISNVPILSLQAMSPLERKGAEILLFLRSLKSA